MFRATLCPSSGAYQLQQQPLVYRRNVVVAVLLVAVGPDRPRPTTQLPPRSSGKPEAATAVHKLLMMGMRMPETCWAVFKRQAIKLRDWCIWLVDLFKYMMMHGLTNPKNDNINYLFQLRTYWAKMWTGLELFSIGTSDIAYETAICPNQPKHSFTGERKNFTYH